MSNGIQKGGAIEHTNRRRQTYYLHKGVTKSGRANWFFSLKFPASPVESIPEGFEVYETPDGQVFLRKARPKLITDVELLEECGPLDAMIRRYAPHIGAQSFFDLL